MSTIVTRGLIAGAALLASVAAQASTLKPITYQVTVRSSFGTKFSDCFAFDGAGNLTVAGLPAPLVYQNDGLNTAPNRFGAVLPLAGATTLGFAIEFHGIGLGNGTQGQGYIQAAGVSDQGSSFIVKGPAVSSCAAKVRTGGGAYRRP